MFLPEKAMQVAFVVEDIQAAMTEITASLGAGPWFFRERGIAANQNYRGTRVHTELAIAMAYSGDILLELIQQLDDGPSVFRDIIKKNGFGLHHIGIGARDFEATLSRYVDTGHVLAFQAQVANGARIAYLEKQGLPWMVEIIELLDAAVAMFAEFRRAHLEWSGQFEIRPLAALRSDGR
jgi:Glyoxalase/Bleomycin resistance protein/Dioxygenase superfamily